MLNKAIWLAAAAAGLGVVAVPAQAQVTASETRGSSDERAASMVALMTLDEKLTLLKGYFGTDFPPRGSKRPTRHAPARPATSPASPASASRRSGRPTPGLGSPRKAARRSSARAPRSPRASRPQPPGTASSPMPAAR